MPERETPLSVPLSPLLALPRSPWRLWALITFPAIFVAARLVAPYALSFDLMASVSYFAAVPLACTAFLAWSGRHWGVAIVAAILAIVAAAPVVAEINWGTPICAELPAAKILFCNIEGRVSAVGPLLALIEREQPDIVGIVEADKPVIETLLRSDYLANRFPFQVIPRIGLEWPHVMLSRHPLQSLPLRDEQRRYRWLYTFHRAVTVALPCGKVIFSAEHLPSPRRTASWKDGNQRVGLLGALIGEQLTTLGLPIVIAGDFNTTPTGYRQSLLQSSTGLRPDRLSGFPVGTWPSWFPPYCRLPLDRVWGSDNVIFLSSSVLEGVGSDHRPISVTFRIRQ